MAEMKDLAMNRLFCAMLAALITGVATAVPAEAQKRTVPKSAKQLSKTEIIAAFGGKKVLWRNDTEDGYPQNGYDIFSKSMTSAKGLARQPRGNFSTTYVMRISFRGNVYCFASKSPGAKTFSPSPPICVKVLRDGGKYYLVKANTGKLIIVSTVAN